MNWIDQLVAIHQNAWTLLSNFFWENAIVLMALIGIFWLAKLEWKNMQQQFVADQRKRM